MHNEINEAMRELSDAIWRQLLAEPLTQERISADEEDASAEPMRTPASP